jgi:hypothetical protein
MVLFWPGEMVAVALAVPFGLRETVAVALAVPFGLREIVAVALAVPFGASEMAAVDAAVPLTEKPGGKEMLAVEMAVWFAVNEAVPTPVPFELCVMPPVLATVLFGNCGTEMLVAVDVLCVCGVSAVTSTVYCREG